MNNMFKSFGDFLNEKEGEAHEYGCAMLFFDFPELKDIQSKISEDDLYTEEDDRSYGLENEPHVTLLYGLHADVFEIEIFEAIDKHTLNELVLYKVSTFDNPNYDVLKFDVDASYLHDINKSLKQFPHTNDFPEYHPHSTIGYLKPDTGSKYVNEFKDLKFTVKPTKVVYSKPNGTKIIYELKQSKE